jgi:hypothetical protein
LAGSGAWAGLGRSAWRFGAGLVLLPAGPSPLDIMAARDALALAREARTQRGDGKPLIRFVPFKVVDRTVLGRDLPESLGDLGEPALPGMGLLPQLRRHQARPRIGPAVCMCDLAERTAVHWSLVRSDLPASR